MSVTVAEAAEAVIALLEGAHDLDVFDGQVKARLDSDRRAHPYAVLYAGSGRDNPDEERESGNAPAMSWEFQVTAAGGDVTRCRRAVDGVRSALLRKHLFPEGGIIRLVVDPGPEREDTSVTPSRWFVPMVFNVSLP